VSRSALTLAGRGAIVTGAGSGIGRALALETARRCMTVAICDVNESGLGETEMLVRNAGTTVTARAFDVMDRAALDAFADAVRQTLPSPALLFANAGILRQGSILGMAPEMWDMTVGVNLLGAVRSLQALVPLLAEPAQVVITGSIGSMSTVPGLGAYCATKHALWPIAETLRLELEAEGKQVGVSLLMPGAVKTAIFHQAAAGREEPKDSIAPEKAARIAIAGAMANLPFILTHPRFIDRARARFDEVIAAFR
jgi:NAD(P)-dependent dehydrogenase (short-subunit alcohol dehydrogenase family)